MCLRVHGNCFLLSSEDYCLEVVRVSGLMIDLIRWSGVGFAFMG
jgi:hypothetical protein